MHYTHVGQETTATMLTFALIKLCQHPEVQQRLFQGQITEYMHIFVHIVLFDMIPLFLIHSIYLYLYICLYVS